MLPTIHIRIKTGRGEVEVKTDGGLDKDALQALKELLIPLTNALADSVAIDCRSRDHVEDDDSPSIPTPKRNIYRSFKDTIVSVFRYGQWFTSMDAKEAYYDLYGQILKASTVTTYLRRMEREGILISKKEGKIIKFRLAQPQIQEKQPQRVIIDPF